MGLVSEELLNRIRKQVAGHGTVLWYDPAGEYADLAGALTAQQVGCEHLRAYSPHGPTGGFLALRHALEPLWGSAEHAPRLLIYVPLARARAANALIEYETGGVVVQPGQHPPEQDTALESVARAALGRVLPPAAAAKFVAQLRDGLLTLAELDRLAEQGLEAQTGALAAVFDSGSAQEIALRFLAGPGYDAEIERRQAAGALRGLLFELLDVEVGGATPPELRRALARQVLMTDYLAALNGPPPAAYAAFPLAGQEAARQATAHLARTWRNRRDAADSYRKAANEVAAEMAVASAALSLDALRQVETFQECEQQLLRLVEQELLQRVNRRLTDLIRKRAAGFWPSQEPDVKKHWEVVAAAAETLAEAARIEGALKGKSWRAETLLAHYAYGDAPWCGLDAAQRRLERDFHQFDPHEARHDDLLKLVAHARLRYNRTAGDLAERFIAAFAADRFEAPGVPAQADVYAEFVAASREPTAYLLIDALRYEMARELAGLGGGAWQHDLKMALATPPTITGVGMAALMPGAERGLALEAGPGDRLEAIVDGVRLRNRADRVAHFVARAAGAAVATTVDQLAPLANPKLAAQLKGAATVLATGTDEIDGIWENNPSLARRMMDDALNQLRRAVRTLFACGIRRVVVTADHGFVLGERLTSPLAAPGGQTMLLKRRVWLGKGGSQDEGVLRRPLSAFGIGGELELATPASLAYFSAPGGTEYFHGGLSLPEVVIPVLVLTPGAPAPGAGRADSAEADWQLRLGSRTIATRFLSVTVEGAGGLLPVPRRAVRVEVRAGSAVISTPVSAAYGFQEDTKDVTMEAQADAPQHYRANTVTLLITDERTGASSVSIHLLDADTGRSLGSLDSVPFTISL